MGSQTPVLLPSVGAAYCPLSLHVQVSIDLFLAGTSYVDICTLNQLSKYTGGQITHVKNFSTANKVPFRCRWGEVRIRVLVVGLRCASVAVPSSCGFKVADSLGLGGGFHKAGWLSGVFHQSHVFCVAAGTWGWGSQFWVKSGIHVPLLTIAADCPRGAHSRCQRRQASHSVIL